VRQPTGVPIFPMLGGPVSGTVPIYSTAADPTTGFGARGAAVADVYVSSVNIVEWTATNQNVGSSYTFNWTSGASASSGSVDTSFGRAAAGVIGPAADSGTSLGNSAKRFTNIVGNTFQSFASVSDANPQSQLSGNILSFGVGGATAVDVSFTRTATSGQPLMTLLGAGTLSASPADAPLLTLSAAIAGAFTITRFTYLKLTNPTGAATVTDAAAFGFDAAVGTHKALASNGAVATVLGSVGPAGSQTTVQGWLKINVNGTLRYIPFF
jgi:hypothetical protein